MKTFPFVEIMVVMVIASSQAHAQANSKSEGKPPSSVKDICIELEGSVVTLYKATQNSTAKFVATENPQERQRLSSAAGMTEELMAKREASWERLGCASILYGKK